MQQLNVSQTKEQFYPTREQFLEDFDCNTTVLIGRGTFGNVFKMKCNVQDDSSCLKNQEYYAVKYIEAVNEAIFQKIQNEFFINKLIERHQNIVTIEKVYAWQELMPTKFILVLVMELADHSLSKEIEQRKKSNIPFSNNELESLFDQCFQAFSFLVNKKIYHRDIKPENILVINDEQLKVKITDFGLSKTLIETKIQDSLKNTLVGTPVYLSPILWQAYIINKQQKKNEKIKHDLEKSDIFSLGVSFIQCALLLTQEIFGLNQEQVGIEKTTFLLNKVENPWIQQILSKMLEFEEQKRATYKELIEILKNRAKIEQQGKVMRQVNLNLELYENIFCKSHRNLILTYFCYDSEIKKYVCNQCLIEMRDNQKNQLLSLPNLINTKSLSQNGMNVEGNSEILDYLTFKIQLILAEAVKAYLDMGGDKERLQVKLDEVKEMIYFKNQNKRQVNLENLSEKILKGKKIDEKFSALIYNLINKNQIKEDLQQVIQILANQDLFNTLKDSILDQLQQQEQYMLNSYRSQKKRKIFEDRQKTYTQKISLSQNIGPSILIKKKGMKIIQESYIQVQWKIEYLHFLDNNQLLVSMNEGNLNLLDSNKFILLYKCLSSVTAIYRTLSGEIHIFQLKDQQIIVQNIIKDNQTEVTSIHYNIYSQLLFVSHQDGIIQQFNNLKMKSIDTNLQNIQNVISIGSIILFHNDTNKVYYFHHNNNLKIESVITGINNISQITIINPTSFLVFNYNYSPIEQWLLNNEGKFEIGIQIKLDFCLEQLAIYNQNVFFYYTNDLVVDPLEHLKKVKSEQLKQKRKKELLSINDKGKLSITFNGSILIYQVC